MKNIATSLCIMLFALSGSTQAQRHKGSHTGPGDASVPVSITILANGNKTKGVEVQVYEENEQIAEFVATKKRFGIGLNLNTTYTLIFSKEGYQPKSVFINTAVPEAVINSPSYFFTANLEPADKFSHSDPFYLDFPGAIVRWDDGLKGFDQQMAYLNDVQSKVAQLKVQIKPR